MNKEEFASSIAENNKITKKEAIRTIEIFTEGVIKAMSKKEDISLIGFGNFTASDIPAREGRNPRTGAPLKVGAYRQPKFKAGKKLKDACNSKR